VSRVSDSALTATVDVGGVTKNYGVTIGGSPAAPWSGTIDVIDLMATPPTVTPLSAGDPMDNTMPTDLDFSSIKKKVFVRCEALPHEPPLATSGRDVLVVDMSTATPFLQVGISPQIGGQGLIRSQVDSMIIHRLRAVSVSEGGTSPGYVHTSTNP
jgi:hypothetical protein